MVVRDWMNVFPYVYTSSIFWICSSIQVGEEARKSSEMMKIDAACVLSSIQSPSPRLFQSVYRHIPAFRLSLGTASDSRWV